MKWTRDSIQGDLVKLLRKHAPDGMDITDTSRLVADLGMDSLGVMETVADVEDTFGLSIPDDALRNVETVGDVVGAIETRLAADGRLDG